MTIRGEVDDYIETLEHKDSGRAVIEGEWIVIRVAIPALTTIVDQSPNLCGLRVTDTVSFAAEVVDEINREDENGSTLFHRMFDDAVEHAIDAGSEHVEAACVCGHAHEEHGNVSGYPGSTECAVCDCMAYERDAQ